MLPAVDENNRQQPYSARSSAFTSVAPHANVHLGTDPTISRGTDTELDQIIAA